MPRFVLSHYGLDGGQCKPTGAAKDFFDKGGKVGAYTFTVMPDEERPLLYIYLMLPDGRGKPDFRPERDLLYVDLDDGETPDKMVSELEDQFKDRMPGRSFYAISEEEFKRRQEETRLEQESYMK